MLRLMKSQWCPISYTIECFSLDVDGHICSFLFVDYRLRFMAHAREAQGALSFHFFEALAKSIRNSIPANGLFSIGRVG